MAPPHSWIRTGCYPMEKFSSFQEIWLVTIEYVRPSGEHHRPNRLRALESRSGRTLDTIGDELRGMAAPPFDAESVLVVAYDAAALLGCFLTLAWALPRNVLDLEAEFRCHASGLNE